MIILRLQGNGGRPGLYENSIPGCNAVIEGLVIQLLKQIPDERGKVMHMLRSDSGLFTGFGEIYFSIVNPGAVKAWKRHLRMTQNLAVPTGRIRLVVYDSREGSPTFGSTDIIETGEDNYCLVKIPPLLWYGFKGISTTPSLIANCADLPHDPAEVERADLADPAMPKSWDL